MRFLTHVVAFAIGGLFGIAAMAIATAGGWDDELRYD